MPDAIEVDLEASRPDPSGGGSRWGWLFIGVGLGIALSALVGFSAANLVDRTSGSTTTTLGPGVSVAIPDFPDGVSVLVAPGEGRAFEVLTWPRNGEPISRSVPIGDLDLEGTPAFDESGEFLAATIETPAGLILLTGRSSTVSAAASQVTGFAWHDSDPADLAWSRELLGVYEVWVSLDASPGEMALQSAGGGTELVAFGDWGVAVVQHGEGPDTTMIFGPPTDGVLEEVGTVSGEVLASSAGGRLLVLESGGVMSLTRVDDLGERTAIEPGLDRVVAGSFSPTGDLVAVTGETMVSLIDTSTLEVVDYEIRAGSESIAWSSDGKFVVVSTFRGVDAINTETGAVYSIFGSHLTRAVTATPIPGT